MKHFKLNNEGWAAIEWRQFIANNLAQHGCALFLAPQPSTFDFEKLKARLGSSVKEPEKLEMFPINVFDFATNQLTTHYAVVHIGPAPYAFFDTVRRAAFALDAGEFYACDLQTDSIMEMGPFSTYKVGALGRLKALLGLTEGRHISGRWIKWFGFPDYLSCFHIAKAYSCPAEQAFYEKYRVQLNQFCPDPLELDTFYSLEECQDHLAGNELKFERATALEFDLSSPGLKISAPSLKAKNLEIETLSVASELFCQDLKAKSITCPNICAERIECQSLEARSVKTSFEGGLNFIGG